MLYNRAGKRKGADHNAESDFDESVSSKSLVKAFSSKCSLVKIYSSNWNLVKKDFRQNGLASNLTKSNSHGP